MGKSNTVTAQIHYKGSNKDIKMIITLKEVMSYKPCPGSNPEQYGIKRISLVNLLKKEEIPAEDRVWAACHVLARKDRDLLVSFANWCAANAAAYANASDDDYADDSADYAAAYAARAADYAYVAANAAADSAATYAASAADSAADSERQKQVDWLIEKLKGSTGWMP